MSSSVVRPDSCSAPHSFIVFLLGCYFSRTHSVAGGVAGSAAVLFLHPFDVVKTRLQGTTNTIVPLKYQTFSTFNAMCIMNRSQCCVQRQPGLFCSILLVHCIDVLQCQFCFRRSSRWAPGTNQHIPGHSACRAHHVQAGGVEGILQRAGACMDWFR